jgi:hypothetical protein
MKGVVSLHNGSLFFVKNFKGEASEAHGGRRSIIEPRQLKGISEAAPNAAASHVHRSDHIEERAEFFLPKQPMFSPATGIEVGCLANVKAKINVDTLLVTSGPTKKHRVCDFLPRILAKHEMLTATVQAALRPKRLDEFESPGEMEEKLHEPDVAGR